MLYNQSNQLEEELEEEEPTVDNDEEDDDDRLEDDDVILNMIHGDNESEEDGMKFVPNFRTVTRGGRLAGTLGICLTSLTQEPETSNGPQSDSDVHEIENQREDSESDGSSNDCDTSGDR